MPVHMMMAIRFHEFGGPEVLRYEDAPKPGLKPGEVLVRVHAVGVNPPDWYLREGNKMLPPEWRPPIALPAIPGSDVSGVVEAVAAEVPGFVVGNEVFGMVRFPSFGDSAAYAEYVAAPASDLALKPAGIDHVHAAAAPMSLLTAWQFLIDVGHDHPNPVQPGPHRPVPLAGAAVLVNGAVGGVGHLGNAVGEMEGCARHSRGIGRTRGVLAKHRRR
ncbi:NADP-dependent oxidoreductase [Verticiella sediminum]|uniref:NADP-dependent oxidoreductase n=1 Tax=Verticiella sediminum TaxID=1247510 RepID=UPI001FE88CF5|nr:NADP-dependent oxidoreductase [Verticiella sediminum]